MLSRGEFDLIDRIQSLVGDIKRNETRFGIGDDAAVLDVGLKDEFLLLASDSIVEGRHFLYNDPDKHLIGRKAVGSVLSDIAAMGGYPLSVVVDVGICGYVDDKSLDEIFSGMRFLLDLFSVDLVGGDVVSSDVLYLSVSCVGKVEKDKVVYRGGANLYDCIWVSGPLGGSRYGRHLCVSPRIPEARFLVQNFSPTAMIDISDGLVSDLYHILEESNACAQIDLDIIPLHKDARSLDEALYMGEDFELLFCLSERESKKMEMMLGVMPYKFYKIGKITAKGEVGLYGRQNDTLIPLANRGFRHF